MAKHSRHHRRSLLSGVRKWMGFSQSTQKVHRTHFRSVETSEDTEFSTQEKDKSKEESLHQVHVHHRQAGVHTSRQSRKPKKKSPQKLMYKLTGLFTGNRNTRRKSYISQLWLRINKLAGAGSNQRKPELFYKLDKDGEYKLIQANPVTSTGINEEGISPKRSNGEKIHFASNKRSQGWERKLSQLIHGFKRIYSGNRQHTRSHKHSVHSVAQVAETIPVPVPNDYVYGHSKRQKQNYFSFVELINSWFRLSYLLKLMSAAGLFMTAYVISWLTYSVFVMFIASFYDIYGVLYFFEIMWPESNSPALMNENNAFAIAFAGPFISMVMSVLYFALLLNVKNLGTQLKTFIFWLFLLSMAHFAGAIVAGAITPQGFGYMMYGKQTTFIFSLLISILSLGAMVLIGWKYSRFILEIRLLRKHGNNILLILINRMVLPVLLGILLLIFIKMPNTAPQHSNILDYDLVILLSVLFAVIPPLFNKKLRPILQQSNTLLMRDRTERAIFAIIFSIAVLIMYRFELSTGLFVYMKFAINISPF